MLKKTYDTVNHENLLKKLEVFGVGGVTLDWFKSYRSNREQCVRIDDCKSEYRHIDIGVPQGSVLGGLLFLIYINVFPWPERGGTNSSKRIGLHGSMARDGIPCLS